MPQAWFVTIYNQLLDRQPLAQQTGDNSEENTHFTFTMWQNNINFEHQHTKLWNVYGISNLSPAGPKFFEYWVLTEDGGENGCFPCISSIG